MCRCEANVNPSGSIKRCTNRATEERDGEKLCSDHAEEWDHYFDNGPDESVHTNEIGERKMSQEETEVGRNLHPDPAMQTVYQWEEVKELLQKAQRISQSLNPQRWWNSYIDTEGCDDALSDLIDSAQSEINELKRR